MFRNLFYIIRRFKLASLLNILGLSIAFASFIVIMMQVHYENSYNSCHKDADRIFRVESCLGDGNPFYALAARPMEEVLRQSPSVQNVAVMIPQDYTCMVTYRDSLIERSFKENLAMASSDYPKVFTFNMAEGVSSALEDPEKCLIPLSLSQKLFPDGGAIGKTLSFDIGGILTVGGVFYDFPKNSTTRNNVYIHLSPLYGADNWGNKDYYMYVLLDSPASADSTVFTSVADLINLEAMSVAKRSLTNYFRLNSIKETYFSTDVMFDFGETGSRQNNYLLTCIALIIIIIAGINFTNFSTALTPLRIKSINTQKVLGRSVGKIRWSLVIESIIISLFAFFISVWIVGICSRTFIAQLLSPEMGFSEHIPLYALAALLSLATGIFAGLYPSFYLTSFSPALVLKGSFGLSVRGRRLRTVLLCVQYIASVALLIIASFMIIQNRHMLKSDLGYDREQIVMTEATTTFMRKAQTCFNELKTSGIVEAAAFSRFPISTSDVYARWRSYWGEDKQIIIYDCIEVSADFLKVLGVKVYEGRDFDEGDYKLGIPLFIFNTTAKEQYSLEVEKPLSRGKIVGFIPDIQYSTFRKSGGPFSFLLLPEVTAASAGSAYVYFRIPANVPYKETLEKLNATLKKFDPSYPFDIKNIDESIQNAYKKEQNISSLITLASILSILISIVGILSLVTFETLYRRKEIGLRKILGSTTAEIMKMFSFVYIKLMLICSVIAVPIGYFAVEKWLSTFTSRTPIYWWVFPLAFLSITAVTLLTISRQNYKAATENPIEAIKTE